MKTTILTLILFSFSLAVASGGEENLTEKQATNYLNEISALASDSKARIKYQEYLGEVQRYCRANSAQTYMITDGANGGRVFRILTQCDTKPGVAVGSMMISLEIGIFFDKKLDSNKAQLDSMGMGE